jgi:SdrD B-like domain
MKNELHQSSHLTFSKDVSKPTFFPILRAMLCMMLFLCLGTSLEAQVSPSGQSMLIAPGTLSACSRDTVKLTFTNKDGPACGDAGGTPLKATYTVHIPSDNTDIAYQAGSIVSTPAGATATVSGGNLIIEAPVPGFGATTEIKFVVTSTCKVVPLDTLPYFAVSAVYPAGFPVTAESWIGSKMNTGVAQINTYHGSAGYANTIAGFGESLNQTHNIYNTGYGSVDQLKFNMIVSDSLVPTYGSDLFFINGTNVPYGSVSQVATSFPDGQITPLGNGTRYVSFTIKGAHLDAVDGRFDNGDVLTIYDTYYITPTTCVPDMFQKVWIEPICASGGPACSPVDTVSKVIKISAGTPIVSAVNASVDVWDGCPEKNASFTFKNSGIASATNPEVGTAYDVDLSVLVGGIMEVKDLLLGGSGAVPTVQTIPGPIRTINWKVKNALTFNPDGPGGLEDLDGDGFFDDMRPGDSITVSWKWSVPCDLACGADLLYDIKGVTTFTDYCGKLNGASSVDIYKFGFAQTAPVAQVTPLPDYGLMSGMDVQTRTGAFNWNYTQQNVNLTNAVVKLRINYAKDFEVLEPISFLGTTRSLSDFTVLGAGFTPIAGATMGLLADATANTMDRDSALEYTLTAAEVAMLFDNTGDNLTYAMAHISCDSFQTQTNKNGFQLVFQVSTTPCPTTGVAPCGLDLACKKGFAYTINEGCGVKPCYELHETVTRDAAIGTSDVSQTGGPLLTAPTNFYVGDTLNKQFTAQLTGDYPQMEPIGGLANGYRMENVFSLTYDRKPGTPLEVQPLLFIENLSMVHVIDTITGDTIASAPIKYKHFRTAAGLASLQKVDGIQQIDDLGPSDPNYGSFGGLMGYYCNYSSWPIDPAACPYKTPRLVPSGYVTPVYAFSVNAADDRITENYYLDYEAPLAEAGFSFDPGYKKYKFVVDEKWVVNPEYPHVLSGQFLFRNVMQRYANGISAIPGTYMGGCGLTQSIGTIYLKELSVVNPGAVYNSTCGLTINNALYLKSATGDIFPGGETRVPFKLDSITIDLPTEYEITGTNTYAYHQGGATNTGTATNSAATNHIVWTSTGTNGEFPRMDDQAGNNIVQNLSYAIDNVGTDNFVVDNYRIPVKYYLRDEWGVPFVKIDTINIVEGVGDITVSPLGGVVNVSDAGACGNPYMDVLIANNTLYSAGSAIINVEGTASSYVLSIEDLGMPIDPIESVDTGRVTSNRLFAKLGALAPAEQRIVRVYFSSLICEDSLKFVTNFGCNYPAGNDIYANSTTLDSTYIKFRAIDPKLMVGAITPKINVENTCSVVEVVVEVANVKSPNIFKLMAGIKLPANTKYVAGSMRANATNYTTYAPYDYALPAGLITNGANPGDSLIVNLDPVHAYYKSISYGSSGYFFPNCGLSGPDAQKSPTDNTYHGSDVNKVRIKFQVEFTSCPSGNVETILINIAGENYCALQTQGKAAVNILFQGTAATPNAYSCRPNNSKPLYICADVGETEHVKDSMYVMVIAGPATTGTDSVSITIGSNDAFYTLSNFTAAGWGTPTTSVSAQGRTVLTFAVPAGTAAGDSILMPLEYDILIKSKDFCLPATGMVCADLAHSLSFFSTVVIDCPAKGITCTSLGSISRGEGFVPRDLACCAALGNKVWFDVDKDGMQDGSEAGLTGVTVNLYKNGPDGLPGTLDDVFVATLTTDVNGNYMFEDLIPSAGDATQAYNVGFIYPAGYMPTQSVTPGDNVNDTNSDASTTVGLNAGEYRTGSFDLVSTERDTTVDAGVTLPCELTVTSATPSACNPLTDFYTLDVVLTYANAPVGSMITVTTSNGKSVTVAQTTSPQTVNITDLLSDGQVITVTGVFVDDTACTDTNTYTAPAACKPVCPLPNCGTATLTKN